jgi:hypothetical protein
VQVTSEKVSVDWNGPLKEMKGNLYATLKKKVL